MKKVRKAVIPAAGRGLRFLPATKAQPKEMLPIVDRPAIQYIIEEALDSGIEDILIITGQNKRSIEDHFDKSVELEKILKEQGQAKPAARGAEYRPFDGPVLRPPEGTPGPGTRRLLCQAVYQERAFAVLLGMISCGVLRLV